MSGSRRTEEQAIMHFARSLEDPAIGSSRGTPMDRNEGQLPPSRILQWLSQLEYLCLPRPILEVSLFSSEFGFCLILAE